MNGRRADTGGAEDTGSASCSHHWVIQRPDGATSEGVCKACGERREFHNYVHRTGWQQKPGARAKRPEPSPLDMPDEGSPNGLHGV